MRTRKPENKITNAWLKETFGGEEGRLELARVYREAREQLDNDRDGFFSYILDTCGHPQNGNRKVAETALNGMLFADGEEKKGLLVLLKNAPPKLDSWKKKLAIYQKRSNIQSFEEAPEALRAAHLAGHATGKNKHMSVEAAFNRETAIAGELAAKLANQINTIESLMVLSGYDGTGNFWTPVKQPVNVQSLFKDEGFDDSSAAVPFSMLAGMFDEEDDAEGDAEGDVEIDDEIVVDDDGEPTAEAVEA